MIIIYPFPKLPKSFSLYFAGCYDCHLQGAKYSSQGYARAGRRLLLSSAAGKESAQELNRGVSLPRIRFTFSSMTINTEKTTYVKL